MLTGIETAALWHISRSGHLVVTFIRSQLAFNSFGTDIRIPLIQTLFWNLANILAFRADEFGSLPGSSPVSHKWIGWP